MAGTLEERQTAIRAELKTWLDGCVVPLLVREFLAERERKKGLEVIDANMAKFTAMNELSAEVLQ
jgi:hypothetical protein